MEKWSHTDFVGGTFFLVMETGSRMSRKFREWQPDAGWLFPPSPRDWLPEEQLVYFLLDVTGLNLVRAEVRRGCTSPECGANAEKTHVLAKRGYCVVQAIPRAVRSET